MMKVAAKYSQIVLKTCCLCNKSSEAEGVALSHFGEWLVKKDITVHYYCLLLSTNLEQRGEDHSGILGFQLRDIRLEIDMAKKRQCVYCLEMSATIQCFTCKAYFHLTCGHTNKCLSQFNGDFKSYCKACVPADQLPSQLLARRRSPQSELCFICVQLMGTTSRWLYAKCCGNGFIHSQCMKMYALSAGYYLTCIWCKDKRFREDIKSFGVFVPDRDANWEREKGAYVELYQGHRRCDMDTCNCPKGRYYTNSFKWKLILCKLCGAFGAHNPACIPGLEGSKEKLQEFKCDVCSVTEQTVANSFCSDTSLYASKVATTHEQSVSTDNSADTTQTAGKNDAMPQKELAKAQIESALFTLTQSPQVSQQLQGLETAPIRIKSEETAEPLTQCPSVSEQEESPETAETFDIVIADLLVEKLFALLQVNN